MADVKSRNDLISRALQVLGAVAAGQSPASEDFDLINTNLDAALAQLAAERTVYVPNPDEIDLEIFLPLATVVAGKFLEDFGLTANQTILAKIAEAEGTLKKMGSTRPTYEHQRVEYF